jgi:hypothetical protein
MAPSSEGDRTVDRSTYVRTDLIVHRVLSPDREPIENADRSERKGALVVAVLRGRSATTSALDNLGLLIEGLEGALSETRVPALGAFRKLAHKKRTGLLCSGPS